jgi:hypothetical protein
VPKNLVDSLNSAILSDPKKGVFFGGQGVVIRNLDDGLPHAAKCRVVPGTFWHNDIWPPNQVYPAHTNIMDGKNGTNWVTPTLAAVIGPEFFSRLFSTANLQDKNWIDGVWYAHDSNSCDKRALFVPKYDGYDAPYAWIHNKSGNVDRNSEKNGSGDYGPGNPTLPKPLGGGGTGVHVKYNWDVMAADDSKTPHQIHQAINQIDGKEANPGRSLVADNTCQIDYHSWNPQTRSEGYDAVDGWKNWITAFAADAHARGYTGEAWIADLAMGWLNNPRPMITLQNALWKYRATWCTGNKEPSDPNSDSHYWGWNEIPFSKDVINDHNNWTSFVIVLPPGITSLHEALKNNTAQTNLIAQLETYQNHYHLRPNESSVVLARQVKNPFASTPPGLVWMREFFAEDGIIGGGWSIRRGIIHR